ncbi:MAG: ATP-dependent DNA helicase RecG, partial [Bifidobacterium pseudocatenulatum]
IVVATHAAFSKSFQAPNLTLAVIDEQHRFGVEQRESLNSKGSTAPHLLVMTATPIPRTAAMTWFGDLDISSLTELPGGRKPIRTFVVPEDNASLMGEMFALIRKRIDAGERAYVVCPRIDADAEDADGALAASAASGSKTAGSSAAAFDDAYDLGEDDDRRAQRPPLHSVAEIVERLQSLPQFKGIRFATLTGRDDDTTKSQVMADFE